MSISPFSSINPVVKRALLACVLVLWVAGGAHAQALPQRDKVSDDSSLPAHDAVSALLPDTPLTGEDQPDAYLCTSVALPKETMHISSFQAVATSGAVTSLMLYGCKAPAEDAQIWSCYMRSPCGAGREAVLTGWSPDAPAAQLPEDVSFSVGAGTGLASVVLQVHYAQGRPKGDAPGFRLSMIAQPTPYSAGMITFASDFAIPPGKPSHRVTTSCCYAGFEPLHVTAFRVHTHELGRLVWTERKSKEGHSRIAEGDPRRGQGFSALSHKVRLLPGDTLTTTCDFDSSSRKEETVAGADMGQEMCNMFLQVWGENPYFMVCGNNQALVRPEGPGGIPEGAILSRVGGSDWQPPTPIGISQNDGTHIGQVPGLTKGEGDTLWVLHRGSKPWDAATFFSGGRAEHITDATPIRGPIMMQLKQDTGEVLQSWGDGKLVMPHSVTVSHSDGALWVADVGRHQALKFAPDGKLLQTLGQANKPGHDTAHFCKPTSVAVSNSGDIFVADGYCNSRIMHFTSQGDFVQQIVLPNGKLQVPHSIAADDCANALYVADRNAGAVRRFHMTGDFAGELSRSWDLSAYGMTYALTAAPYGALLALAWDPTAQLATLLHLDTALEDNSAGSGILDSWEISGLHQPHDIALSAAPTAATMGGSRTLAVYISETAHGRASRILKFVIHSPAVDLVQAPRTRLADIDLPDLEDAVLGGGARGGGAAASDIERAAAQIERAAEQLQRLAASKELSQAQREAAAAAASAAAAMAGTELGHDLNLGGHGHWTDDIQGTSSGSVRKAGAAVGKAGVAVGQTFGLQAKPKPKGVGHYIMLILAPVGALAVFGALAIFLSHRMGAWPPSGTSGFTPLPTRDDYLVASPASGATLDTSRLKSKEDDTAEVVVSRQVDLSKSVRRASAAAADLRRVAVAAAAAAAEGPAPSPLGDDSLQSRTGSGGFVTGRRGSGEMDRGGVRTGLMMGAGGRPSVRRASASTASSMSSDMMRRMGGVTAMQAELRQHRQVAAAAAAVHAGGRQGMFAGGGEELGGHWHRTPDHSPYQQMTSGWDERQYLQPSDVTDGLTSSGSPCSGDGGGLASAAAVQPDSAVTPSAPPPPPRRGISPSPRGSGVARASWSGSLSSISELISPATMRELAATVARPDGGAGSSRRASPLMPSVKMQQD